MYISVLISQMMGNECVTNYFGKSVEITEILVKLYIVNLKDSVKFNEIQIH